jgi:hypothetical protein
MVMTSSAFVEASPRRVSSMMRSPAGGASQAAEFIIESTSTFPAHPDR